MPSPHLVCTESLCLPLRCPCASRYLQALQDPQWINCDVRSFDMTVLGKFGVIMADPPWEIHQVGGGCRMKKANCV